MSKHMSLDDRILIQQGLNQRLSFRKIAGDLGRSLSTVSREVKRHRTLLDTGAVGRVKNRCTRRRECHLFGICLSRPDCMRRCSTCHHCNANCKDFHPLHCPRLNSPPYVCNGCQDKPSCVLQKYQYSAKHAQATYASLLVEARSGLNISEDEMRSLDALVSPLLKNGQSIYHVSLTQRDALIRSGRSLYRFLHAGLLSAKPIDMPRVCRLKPRRSGKPSLKVDRACRSGRTYSDFNAFIALHPGISVVQMDTVIGRIGGKLLLSLHLTAFDFMIALLHEHNTARAVTLSLNNLRQTLSPDLYAKLFPVLLTDNGSEFSNPSAIEFPASGDSLTRVFYCDPQASFQKPNVELNHEFIRRFFPKGSSFDALSQPDISLMMSHINSYGRDKFGGLSPAALFANAFGLDTLHLLGQVLIPPVKIVLNRSLLSR